MLTVRQLLAVLVTGCVTACHAAAQETTERVLRPLLGKVVDAEGNDVAGAEVHLSFAPIGDTGLAASEHQVATTDNRGRFRFQARPCTKHLIWAIGTPDEDGERLVTTLRWISPGRPFELVADQKHPASTLTILGIEAWADYAPFRLQIAPGGIPVEGMTVDLDPSGACTLPPLPDGQSSVTIHDKHGQALATVSSSKHQRSIRHPVHVMQELPMLVVDPQGKPIAGVTIRERIKANGSVSRALMPRRPNGYRWREHGKTDADGKLIAKVACSGKPFKSTDRQGLFFMATKQGLNTTHSGISRMPFFDGQQVKREGVTELKFTLKEAKPTTLRLMSSPEHGLANQMVTLKSEIKVLELDHNGWTHESIVFNLTTDADGFVRMPALTEPIGRFEVVLGGESVTGLIPRPLRRMAPYRAIALHGVQLQPGKEQRVDLHKAATVKLQILGEHGGPVTDAELILISMANENDYNCDGWNTMATTDSAGRVALRMQSGRWCIFVRTKTGMAHIKLKLEHNETKELDVNIETMTAMHGLVVDGDGKPIANARLDIRSRSWSSGDNRDPTLEAIAQNLNWTWIDNTTTDKDGKFTCAFLDLPSLTYKVRVRHGKKQSPDFQVNANDSPVTITIE